MLKFFNSIKWLFLQSFSKEEMNIEDSARLLAQALVGDGFIYLHGTNEMEGVVAEALFGAEPMKQAKRLFENGKEAEVTSADRVLLISRFSTDEAIVEIAKTTRRGTLYCRHFCSSRRYGITRTIYRRTY